MKDTSYKIYSLGCKVNQYDGDKLGGLLKSAGFIFADKDADAVIINSCAVTVSAIAKSRAMIKKARRENPRAKIILTGCLAKICGKDFSKQAGVDLIISGNNFEIKKIEKLFPLGLSSGRRQNSKFKILNPKSISSDKCLVFPRSSQNRSRYFLKIQDGCEQFCTYCIIPYTRGKLQSRPPAEVLAEAEAAVKAGWQEIVLTGIHLGLFGINNITTPSRSLKSRVVLQGGDENLLALLKKIVKIDGLKKIRLSSIEVTEVGDELINFMAQEKKMCRHLHIPLQAGSEKILRLMKRPYDLKFFAGKITELRKKMPDIAISTDVIVGFPGESAKDFQDAEKFIGKMKFSRLHVFSFSAHERTLAFGLPDKVEPVEIKRRSEILRKLSDKLAAAYQKRFSGKILEVIVEHNRSSRTGLAKGEKMKGKTEYYFNLYFDQADIVCRPAKEELIGQVIKVKSS